MSTISYKIKRWGGLLTGNNINPQPVVYIKPDMDLMNFAKVNDNKLIVSITETDLPYENKKYLGVITLDPKRPNYFNETGYYMVVLVSDWYGEPEDFNRFGNLNIHRFRQVELSDNSTQQLNSTTSTQQLNSIMNEEFNSKVTIPTTLVLIIILVCILGGFLVYRYRNGSQQHEELQKNPYINIKPKYIN